MAVLNHYDPTGTEDIDPDTGELALPTFTFWDDDKTEEAVLPAVSIEDDPEPTPSAWPCYFPFEDADEVTEPILERRNRHEEVVCNPDPRGRRPGTH